MDTLRARGIALIWFVGVCVLSAWIISVRGPTINTNLLALLPKTDRDPAIVAAIEKVQTRLERHIAVLVGAEDFPAARRAADIAAIQLKTSGHIRKLNVNGYRDLGSHAFDFYFARRFHLLSTGARSQLLAGDTAKFEQSLLERYFAPQTSVGSGLIDNDPLLLLPAFLEERTLQASARQRIRDGYLTVEADNRVYIALIGELTDSPFSTTLQQALIPEFNRLRTDLPKSVEGSDILVAGVLPHAAAGTQSGIDEMSTVGLGSLLAIVFLLVAMFRSVRPFALTLCAIGMGCLSGFAACLLIFREIHLLTLIFGSSLVGISVDYSFHYFCERFRLTEDWSPVAARRHVFPGITLGLVTSIIGFAGLFLTPFPGMRGVAVFSMVGLVVAWGCVILCYPVLTARLSRPHFSFVLVWLSGYTALWQRRWSWHAYGLSGIFLLAAIAGCLNLKSDDNIRLLQTPDAAVMAEESRIRALIGRNLASQILILEGKNPGEYLSREEALTAELKRLQAQNKLIGYLAISDFVASPDRQRENRKLIDNLTSGDASILHSLSKKIGLPETTRKAYVEAFRKAADAPPTGIAEWLAHPVSAPHRHLWLGSSKGGVMGVVGLRGVYDLNALQELAAKDPHVHFVDPAGDISDLFGRYRSQTILLTLVSYCVVLLVLVLRYGAMGGVLVIAPPVIAAVASLGVLGFLGHPISLFNVMALLLVLGIGVDYSLFFRETGADSPTTLLAIALSCITTILAFGLLSLSATTAISAFGLTVLLGIVMSFLLSPIAGWIRPAKAMADG